MLSYAKISIHKKQQNKQVSHNEALTNIVVFCETKVKTEDKKKNGAHKHLTASQETQTSNIHVMLSYAIIV